MVKCSSRDIKVKPVLRSNRVMDIYVSQCIINVVVNTVLIVHISVFWQQVALGFMLSTIRMINISAAI